MSMSADCLSISQFPLPGEGFIEQMCSDYLPLVRRVVRRMQRTLPRHIETDDLISAGVVGLLGAARRYQDQRSVPFEAFAQIRIRGAVLDFLRQEDWAPRELRRRARTIADATSVAAQKLGRDPDQNELAVQLGMPLAELQASLAELRLADVESLHEASDDADSMPIDSVVEMRQPDALASCLAGELRSQLTSHIEALPERQRLVITLYYFEELSMSEIAEVLGVGVSRVSQLHSSAVRKLRSTLEAGR